MFQLSTAEKLEVVTNCDHLQQPKFSRTLPFAFTEHGAIQASNVLVSARAVEMGLYVVRAFVRLREVLASNKDMTARLDELEKATEALALRQDAFARNTRVQLKQAFDALRELMTDFLPISWYGYRGQVKQGRLTKRSEPNQFADSCRERMGWRLITPNRFPASTLP